MHNVFVYGTLKQGEPNDFYLKQRENGVAKFVGTGRMVNKFPLIITTQYNGPFLLNSKGNGKEVLGEVYEVDDKMLNNLDILEQVPRVYTRSSERVKITINQNEKIVQCWVYLLIEFRSESLDLPHLESYSSNGPHGLQYVPMYQYRDGKYIKIRNGASQNEVKK